MGSEMCIRDSSMWRGIIDGSADCLDVAIGVIDGGRVGRLELARWAGECG